MRHPLAAAGLLTAVFFVPAATPSSAVAADWPVPKIMSDAPLDKGSWRMDSFQMTGRKPEELAAMNGMTVCSTAAQAMARDNPDAKSRCTQKLVEDTSSRAVLETQCTGSDPMSMRSTITRAGPRAYEVATDMTTKGRTESMRMKMSYVGPCSEKDGVIGMSKDSAACQQVQAQMAQMTPDKQCKGATGAQREQCVKSVNEARASMERMCK